ncbi:MAG: cytochrome P450 [Sphingorhabdus sp.]|uniref:cytochrome P450 n=1 Tax=Sphingorhabdus sp. TaxID=1902408 RepID=UPI0038FD150F
MTIQHFSITPATDPKVARAAVFAAARAGSVAINDDNGVPYALDNAQVKALLLDKRLVGGGRAVFEMQDIPPGRFPDWYLNIMFTTEGPQHSRMRRLVGKAFTPRAIDGLRDVAAGLVTERLDLIRANGSGDLMAALSDVPTAVMCALLGVPGADVPRFIAWIDALGPIFNFMTPDQITAAAGAIESLLDYTLELHDRRKDAPADDLISALIAAEEDGDQLTREETAAMVANLLVAGHDTTSSQIGCTLLTLLNHPQAMVDVRDDPAIIEAMVTETIRYEPSVSATFRSVVEPLALGGVDCPTGSLIFLSTWTANRDPAVWPDADSFKPRRFLDPDAPRMLSFGGGPHFCLGAWLARMTLEEVVRGVAALDPRLSVQPETIAWVRVLGENPGQLPVLVKGEGA